MKNSETFKRSKRSVVVASKRLTCGFAVADFLRRSFWAMHRMNRDGRMCQCFDVKQQLRTEVAERTSLGQIEIRSWQS